MPSWLVGRASCSCGRAAGVHSNPFVPVLTLSRVVVSASASQLATLLDTTTLDGARIGMEGCCAGTRLQAMCTARGASVLCVASIT